MKREQPAWNASFSARGPPRPPPAGGAAAPPPPPPGAPGFRDFYERLRRTYGSWVEAGDYPLRVEEISARPLALGSLVLTAVPVVHTSHSVAYRVEDPGTGKVAAFSGDTDVCEGLVAGARHGDPAVFPGSFPTELVGQHVRRAGGPPRRAPSLVHRPGTVSRKIDGHVEEPVFPEPSVDGLRYLGFGQPREHPPPHPDASAPPFPGPPAARDGSRWCRRWSSRRTPPRIPPHGPFPTGCRTAPSCSGSTCRGGFRRTRGSQVRSTPRTGEEIGRAS